MFFASCNSNVICCLVSKSFSRDFCSSSVKVDFDYNFVISVLTFVNSVSFCNTVVSPSSFFSFSPGILLFNKSIFPSKADLSAPACSFRYSNLSFSFANCCIIISNLFCSISYSSFATLSSSNLIAYVSSIFAKVVI